MNVSRPSVNSNEGEMSKTFRWDHRLQIQNPFMAFRQVPRWMVVTLGQQYNTGEKPTVMVCF